MTKVIIYKSLAHSLNHSLAHLIFQFIGMTLLHFAVDRGHLEMTQLLLSTGADKTIVDKDGMTALDYATICEYDSIISLLSD